MKPFTLLSASAFGAVLALGSASLAQTPTIADVDGNGLWSLTELQTVWPDLTEETATLVDTNKDGGVDQTELTAALAEGVIPAVQ